MGILTEDMKRLVLEQRLAHVAAVCPDGTPNLPPKGTIRVWDDDHLVFGDICSPGTMENVRYNAAVEVNVVDVFLRKGYRFKGTARVLSEGPQYKEVMNLYTGNGNGTQLGVANLIRAIVLVEVPRALPLVSPGYTSGVTEEQMSAQWQGHYLSLQRPQESQISACPITCSEPRMQWRLPPSTRSRCLKDETGLAINYLSCGNIV